MFYKKLIFGGLSIATLLKKRLWHRCFPENFANFSKTPFFIEHLRVTTSVHTQVKEMCEGSDDLCVKITSMQ